MTYSTCKVLAIWTLAAVLLSCTKTSEAEGPNWLAGKPDLTKHDERTNLYNWILDEADVQTNGRSRNDSLAIDRLINAANKLAEYHQTSPQERYSTEIWYLVVGGKEPAHFRLDIDAELLDSLLR